VVATWLGWATPAGAATTLSADSSVVLSDPGITLTVPHDGRIRGFDYSARVTGAGFAHSAGAGDQAVTAPAGDYLAVFSVSVNDFTSDQSAIPDFAAMAIVGVRRVPLDVSGLSSGGHATYAVAVPRGAPVSLELGGQGLAQDYSLSKLALDAPVPTVLYRDPDRPEVDIATNSRLRVVGGEAESSPEQSTFEAMIDGWRAQRLARNLALATVESGSRVVQRFAEATGSFPWEWSPADLEGWTAALRAGNVLARSTVRTYGLTIAGLLDYVCDPAYGAHGAALQPAPHESRAVGDDRGRGNEGDLPLDA
jgi:hypothetical protein